MSFFKYYLFRQDWVIEALGKRIGVVIQVSPFRWLWFIEMMRHVTFIKYLPIHHWNLRGLEHSSAIRLYRNSCNHHGDTEFALLCYQFVAVSYFIALALVGRNAFLIVGWLTATLCLTDPIIILLKLFGCLKTDDVFVISVWARSTTALRDYCSIYQDYINSQIAAITFIDIGFCGVVGPIAILHGLDDVPSLIGIGSSTRTRCTTDKVVKFTMTGLKVITAIDVAPGLTNKYAAWSEHIISRDKSYRDSGATISRIGVIECIAVNGQIEATGLYIWLKVEPGTTIVEACLASFRALLASQTEQRGYCYSSTVSHLNPRRSQWSSSCNSLLDSKCSPEDACPLSPGRWKWKLGTYIATLVSAGHLLTNNMLVCEEHHVEGWLLPKNQDAIQIWKAPTLGRLDPSIPGQRERQVWEEASEIFVGWKSGAVDLAVSSRTRRRLLEFAGGRLSRHFRIVDVFGPNRFETSVYLLRHLFLSDLSPSAICTVKHSMMETSAMSPYRRAYNLLNKQRSVQLQIKENSQQILKLRKEREKLRGLEVALEKEVHDELLHYESVARLDFAQYFLNTLPQELRDMVYEYLSYPLEDITIRRREVNPFPIQNRKDFSIRSSGVHLDPQLIGSEVAAEIAAHYHRRTLFIVQDAEDLEKALNFDVFGTGILPRDHVHRIQVDVRTHCHEQKSYLLTSRTDSTAVYDNLKRNMRALLSVKKRNSCKLYIRLRTWGGGRRLWSEAVRTLRYLRPVVLELKEAGLTVFVEHLPVGKADAWATEDLTEQFDYPLQEWQEVQKARLERAKGESKHMPIYSRNEKLTIMWRRLLRLVRKWLASDGMGREPRQGQAPASQLEPWLVASPSKGLFSTKNYCNSTTIRPNQLRF
ncbi:uncharacterized protein BDR25DRAFT_363146 [Lindgomyces ingoldianus]|uniref:Uncharacterized protein n=1 Tax=Lindgomyces ingoldianus TaxID=673940 RepID=A0ACB6QAA8_9PLEO|nr:uncharacterized protein BDR25DRAFT_363146 [Lindgomyces ingoldianus]KAF2463057.1 hypothetical protein BDR25DRAFT_363146 [Lindgomyces ingoldianus]